MLEGMRSSALLCAGIAASLSLAACGGGGDKSEADIRADLSSSLRQGNDNLDQETSDCYADLIIEEVGLDGLRDVNLTDDRPEGDVADQIAAAAQRAGEECSGSG